MHLVQILLPLYDPQGAPIPPALFHAVRAELTDRFGGVTAYRRAPAEGVWQDDRGRIERDDVVMYEVMVESLDAGWWSQYTERLRQQFSQDELMARALPCERL